MASFCTLAATGATGATAGDCIDAGQHAPSGQLNDGELVEAHVLVGGQSDEKIRLFRAAWHEARVQCWLRLAGRRKIGDRVTDERSLPEHAHVLELGGHRVVQRVIVEARGGSLALSRSSGKAASELGQAMTATPREPSARLAVRINGTASYAPRLSISESSKAPSRSDKSLSARLENEICVERLRAVASDTRSASGSHTWTARAPRSMSCTASEPSALPKTSTRRFAASGSA